MKIAIFLSISVFTILIAPTSSMRASAQSTSIALPIKKIDNDTLLEAYKQSISDVSHGLYLNASFGMLKRLGIESADQLDDPDVVDQWAQVMSTMTGIPTFNKAKGADFHVPKEQIADLQLANAVPAIEEIVRRARKTRIVILNENHLDPRCRAFGLEVAQALKPLGYTILAVEALRPTADDQEASHKMEQLMADGVVRAAGDYYSGYYFDDPVFADFIRQSLAMGYRPVSYETAGRGYTDQEREQAQADNLIRRGVQPYPDSKILVYVGERHAAESTIATEEKPYLKMAAILKAKTGIDPLTIDQAGLSSIPMNRPDTDLYKIAASKASKTSVVLFRQGKPFTTGLLANAVDLQVVHPPLKLINGRPDWMLKMHRSPTPIPSNLLPASGIRLVQVFLANSPADARPIDQVLVMPGQTPVLMVPKMEVRYATEDF
ncbi:hypothetical protein CLV59_1011028 [Chitinophaga dinghuensis]|uniref:Calcium-dependent phosphoinositide phospholipase C n=1 Tax=Chitinophaga dinghuensis TaxID=1539050 RepID=A0A327WDD4_9BACT|nr:hypothetical protein CLV59_1011028 [Chitinophaga dinghuensis]